MSESFTFEATHLVVRMLSSEQEKKI